MDEEKLRAEVASLRGELQEARQYHAKQLAMLAEGASRRPSPAPAPAEPQKAKRDEEGPDAAALHAQLPDGKLMDMALRRSKALEKRLKAKDETIAHMAGQRRTEVDATQRELHGYRDRIAQLEEEMRDKDERLLAAERAHQEQLRREVQAVREHSLQAMNQLNARMTAMRESYSNQSHQGEVAQLRRHHAAEMAAAREKWAIARDAEEARERQQYEGWLQERDELVKKLQERMDELVSERDEREQAMREEMGYLYDYVARLSAVLQAVDAGTFPVKEQCGVRTYQLPDHVRQELVIDRERARSLEPYIARTQRFLDHFIVEARPSSPQAEHAATVELARLRGEVTELRRAHEDQRQALEDELVSNETVQYIRALEDRVGSYKEALRVERQRVAELRLAREAHTRLRTKSRAA